MPNPSGPNVSLVRLSVPLLVAAAILPFLPSLGGDFVWDDHLLVEAMAQGRSGGPWLRLDEAFIGDGPGGARYFRPLTSLSLQVDYWLWGLQPPGYHLTNQLLHLLAVLLFWRVALAWLRHPGLALAIAALAAVHPTRAESVAWISGRGDLLAAGLLLASFLAWRRAVGDGGRGGAAAGVGAVVLLLLATLAKETALAFVLLWGLYAAGGAGRRGQKLAWDLFLLLSVVGIYMLLHCEVPLALPMALPGQTVWDRLCLAPANLGQALWLLVVPGRGEPFHPLWLPGDLSSEGLVLFWLGTALTTGLVWRVLHGRGRAGFALAWALLGLWPVLNLVPLPRPILAERFLYLATWGWLLLLGLGLRAELAKGGEATRRRLLLLLPLLWLAWSAGAWVGTLPWRQDVTLFGRLTSLAQAANRSGPAHRRELAGLYCGYGLVLQAAGRNLEALAAGRQTLALAPGHADAWRLIGAAAATLGDEGLALQAHRQAVTREPGNAAAWCSLGAVQLAFGRVGEGEASLREALRLDRGLALGWRNLGVALQVQGRSLEAAEAFAETVARQPGNLPARIDLGLARLRLGQVAAARQQFEAVQRADPGGPQAAAVASLLGSLPR